MNFVWESAKERHDSFWLLFCGQNNCALNWYTHGTKNSITESHFLFGMGPVANFVCDVAIKC